MEKQEQKSDSALVTEQRVTKTVIRRRASVAPAKVEPEVEPETELAPEATVHAEPVVEATSSEAAVVSEPVQEEPAASIEAAASEITEVAVEERLEPEPSAPEPVTDAGASPVAAGPQGPEYLTKYKRIKVVAAPPVPEASAMPNVIRTGDSTRTPESLLASPGSLGLGRREIIEIRDFNRPKGGMRKKRLMPGKKGKKTEITTPKAIKRVLKLSEAVTVSELARKMSLKAGEVIRKLMGMGMMVQINQTIDFDTTTLVAAEFGFEVENVKLAPEDLLLEQEKTQEADRPEDLLPRAPVVTVMGHVDHGKTSLLDAIRKTDVAARESGGITQHIGAYMVRGENGKFVTFIDTPGHEAFTSMRARGAKVTDVVILVVAADDGVMPQTKEAVNHAQAANVPIIVAINKMDKPGADPEKIKKALTEFNLVPEAWGGDTLYVEVSAKTGLGVPQLLETLQLQTEVLDLKSNPSRLAKGTVIEAELDKRRGPVITLLVQSGTLKEGDALVAGHQSGRVRAMNDDKGKRIREAGPSTPVEIMGLAGIAQAGDTFVAVADEKSAKQIAELRQKITREQDMSKTSKMSLEDLYTKIEQGDVKELRLIVKADTTGSVEVLTDTLQKLSNAKVQVRVIHGAVGGITESDIMLAAASSALVIGFHVRPDSGARNLTERQKIDVRLYEIIYELTEDIQKAMAGLLAPKKVEKFLGRIEIRQIFNLPKIGMIAGCFVEEGKVLRSSAIRVVRDSVPVHTGKLASLKRFKDDVREVTTGLECGLTVENFNDLKVGDRVEAYEVEEVAATLE